MFDWLNKNSSSSEQTERTRLMSLSEKELMVEMILELKRISSKCDEIGRKIVIWSNQNYKNLNRGIKENGFGGRIKISFRSRFLQVFLHMWSPIVVKHVVKEPFLTRCSIHCRRLSRRALSHVQVWGIVPLPGPRSKVFFRVRLINF